MKKNKCQICDTELEPIDEFGPVNYVHCYECWTAESGDDSDNCDFWYGLAPHVHDLSITGHIIGSTVLYPLDKYKKENGRYWIPERNAWFTPDDEVGGAMGIWEEK
jgi:hypothetical protein